MLIVGYVVSLPLPTRYAVAPFSFFKKLGIPGPAPWPFVGNIPEMSKKVNHVKLCYMMLD